MKLEPVIKWVDVVVNVTPADAQLKVDGEVARPLAQGAYTHKLQEGKPLESKPAATAMRPRRSQYSPEDLAKLGNKVTIELAPEKAARCPASLVAKPGADVDPESEAARCGHCRRRSAMRSRSSSRS